jgi:2-dehydropantoate 2-reductase
MSVESLGPAQVRHKHGRRVILGEPLGQTGDQPSERLAFIADAFATAGFEAQIDSNIRREIWYKLWGNMTMNPITALAGVTGDKVLADPLVDEYCKSIMREAALVGERFDCAMNQTPEARNAITAKLGAFKTSMLQDVEAGRSLEIDALLSVVREIALQLKIATPNLDALLGLTRLFARQRGLYS